MRSPLNSYADGGRGEVYLSEVDLIQNAANAVSTAAMDIENESAGSKAKRQSKRVDRREKRADNKGTATTYNEDGTVNAQGDTKRDEFDNKTTKIRKKAIDNKVEADARLKSQMEQRYKRIKRYRVF